MAGIADIQNPISNMPLMQQMQQAQHQQAQSIPIIQGQELEEEVREELNTVQQSEEQKEGDRINEEDTNREGDPRRRSAKRRAKTIQDGEKQGKEKPRLSDGVHGLKIDIQA